MLLLRGFLLCVLLSHLTESFTISLQAKDNTIISIKNVIITTPPPCPLCVDKKCDKSSLIIRPGSPVNYDFGCKTPETYYVMEINRTIDCAYGACPLNVSLLPSSLIGLNRTFFWHISALRSNGLVLGFPNPWLQQIHPSDNCPDRSNFKISTFSSDLPITIGTFCRQGTVSQIKVHERGVVALSLPWNKSVKDPVFSVANRTSIKRLCIIESNFQNEFLVTLLSANYPSAFPSNERMTWKFNLPPGHAAAVNFVNYSIPVCDKNVLEVQYYLPKLSTLNLHDKQPANIQNNFNFSLQNCIVDTSIRSSDQPGLTLNFTVTVQKTSGNELYVLDLTKEKDLRVRIGRRKSVGRQFVPACEICKAHADCAPELELEGGKYYKISFFCQDMKILIVEAVKEISCWDLRICNISNMPLTIPESFMNFPVRLDSFTWRLIAPESISTKITSKSIFLQQDTEDKPCNLTASGFTYEIMSSNNKVEFKIGTFCPNGSIEEIQMKDNVTIILRMPQQTDMRELRKHDQRVSFVPFITEECIIMVSPKPEETIYVRTPNWDFGLPDHVSLSWNINVPSKQFGRLKFATEKLDVSCENGRAFVSIKEEKDNGPGVVQRDGGQLPGPLDMYSSFWVNVSNCEPRAKTKKLKLQLSVTFSQLSSGIKYLLIAGGSAVVVVLAVIITVCCVKRKKKPKQAPLGIYNTKVATEAPRRQAFFKKGRKTNESHVYAVIDDTMVYGHLLQEKRDSGPDVDVYRSFDGPMDDPPPVPPMKFPNGSTREDTVLEPLAHSMKENEIYTISDPLMRDPVENDDTSIPYIEESENGTIST
ncbi:PREDICTED: CUB domain-containing protein 1 [Nanorana parkeri]|uniref:CUB domain-containing protein 1 n=1 Tax=Nanorana parkeri TaxID=125878 RepID=UPI00085504C0|nr:PREDICTED: CUB domain-containing protein 1 [Nanorana parkeri]